MRDVRFFSRRRGCWWSVVEWQTDLMVDGIWILNNRGFGRRDPF